MFAKYMIAHDLCRQKQRVEKTLGHPEAGTETILERIILFN